MVSIKHFLKDLYSLNSVGATRRYFDSDFSDYVDIWIKLNDCVEFGQIKNDQLRTVSILYS